MSNIKPTTQLPTEQAAVTTDKPSSTPTGQEKEPDHTVHTPLTQQNGNDQEDIFSPLRESMFYNHLLFFLMLFKDNLYYYKILCNPFIC